MNIRYPIYEGVYRILTFITCFCRFIELLIPYFETATDFNSFGTKCRMP